MQGRLIGNALAFSRIVSFPIIIVLIIAGMRQATAWVYLIMFSTDAWDGFFAHFFGKDSEGRRKLDSYGDVMYLVAGVIGFAAFETAFFLNHLWVIGPLLFLYLLQFLIALSKWGVPTSFHTYSAKVAALVQAVFLAYTFFFGIWDLLFWIAVIFSLLDLAEELTLTIALKKYISGIKSVFLLKKYKQKETIERK